MEMETGAGLPGVDALSCSDEEASAEPAAASKKRKAAALYKRPNLASPAVLRQLLAKPCDRKGKCKRGCKRHFQGRQFERLLKFRRDWIAFHKLDQDQIATWPFGFDFNPTGDQGL